MRFSEADHTGGYLIQGYEAGLIRVAGQTYHEGLIVTPHQVTPGWGPATASALGAEHIEPLAALDPQVIVLGTGQQQILAVPGIYALAYARGIGIEVMSTGAACRTYNILLGEGRKVVAGLLVI